jgi:peptidoglycan hydrolase CwlO-like protein
MKKAFLVISVLGLMFACSGGNKAAEEAVQKQIQTLEESQKKLEQVMDSNKVTIDSLQSEVDELLNEI